MKAITDAINTKPSPEVVDAVVATPDVHPAFASIVAILKGLYPVRCGGGTNCRPALAASRGAAAVLLPPVSAGGRYRGMEQRNADAAGVNPYD